MAIQWLLSECVNRFGFLKRMFSDARTMGCQTITAHMCAIPSIKQDCYLVSSLLNILTIFVRSGFI